MKHSGFYLDSLRRNSDRRCLIRCPVLPHFQADSKHANTRERTLYEAVCSASTWLDGAENTLLSGPVLLSDDSEVQLGHLEVRFRYHQGNKNDLAMHRMIGEHLCCAGFE